MSAYLGRTDVFETDLTGEDYKTLLGRLHATLRPATYLEVGSRDGSSLALATCPSIAIDPMFNLTPAFMGDKPSCCLYRMGSDAFFKSYDPEAILGGKIEFAFLDGLHLAEFLVRDFINVERICRPNSIIAIHDVVPLDAAMARRHETGPDAEQSRRYPGYWTGDVWKAIVALRRLRPALQVMVVDAQPTGVALVTGLDPRSTVLQEHYGQIVQELRALTDSDLASYVHSLDMVKTAELVSAEDIAKHFWL